MQDREVTEKVTGTLFNVAEKLHASVGMIYIRVQEGEMSKEEAASLPGWSGLFCCSGCDAGPA